MFQRYQCSSETNPQKRPQNRNQGENQSNMSIPRESRNDLIARDEHLARVFHANARYNPVFLFVAGIGFLAIYLMTYLGVFGQSAPQLLFIGILTILLAVSQIPLLSLAQRNRGIAANVLASISVGIFVFL